MTMRSDARKRLHEHTADDPDCHDPACGRPTERHIHPDPAVRALIARERANAVAQVVEVLDARINVCARAGGGIYPRSFVNGLEHARSVIREGGTR